MFSNLKTKKRLTQLIIAVVAVVIAMATMLTACGKFTCDACDKGL